MKNTNRSPLSFENCLIEFIRDSEKPSFIRSIFSLLFSLPKRVYNTWLLFKHKEIISPLSKNVCPFRAFSTFHSLFFSFKTTTNPELMKAILKAARKDPDKGLFNDKENQLTLFAIAKDLYPSAKLEIDDSIFTCRREFLSKYRQPILQFVGPNHMKDHCAVLEGIAKETIQEFTRDSKPVNATELSFTFTTNVISCLLLSHPGPFAVYKEISSALDCMNRLMLKKIWRMSLSSDESKEYESSLEVMRRAIETSLQNSHREDRPSFLQAMKEKNLTPLQIKLSLFNIYFAGSETSSSLMSYLLWQLGQHPEYQEEIYQDITKDNRPLWELAEESLIFQLVFAESIRLFTPVYMTSRRPAAPLRCQVKDSEGRIIFEEKIKENEILATIFTDAGKDPSRFEDPLQFNPRRFTKEPSLDWKPFGDGAHVCPGQWLAKSEIAVFSATLIKQYRFTSSPYKEPKQKGLITTKYTEPLWIYLSLR